MWFTDTGPKGPIVQLPRSGHLQGFSRGENGVLVVRDIAVFSPNSLLLAFSLRKKEPATVFEVYAGIVFWIPGCTSWLRLQG